MRFDSLLISCEHASSRVPPRYGAVLRGARPLLATHRACDIGAADLARRLGRDFAAPVFLASWTRLLVDANRSPGHRDLFSEWTRQLDPRRREEILATYYAPYRGGVSSALRGLLVARRKVLHLSVHSFVPRLNGVVRRADVGLLYDPSRRLERALCARWKQLLATRAPALRVRRNYPYRGTSDGFSVALRRQLSASHYACIELEVNQALMSGSRRSPPAGLCRLLGESLSAAAFAS